MFDLHYQQALADNYAEQWKIKNNERIFQRLRAVVESNPELLIRLELFKAAGVTAEEAALAMSAFCRAQRKEK